MRRGPESGSIVDGLVAAYRAGMFPMACAYTGEVRWYTADPRGVLPLTPEEGLHVPRSVERAMRNRGFIVTADTAFAQVMRLCAAPRDEDDEPWIDETLIDWYTQMFDAGYAHSVEAWLPRADGSLALVGGIYGVSVGGAFFGESMFCTPRERREDGTRDPLDGTDASKVCLVTLVRHLAACGYTLFDTQMVTDHVRRFGGHEIGGGAYRVRLGLAVEMGDRWRAPRSHSA